MSPGLVGQQEESGEGWRGGGAESSPMVKGVIKGRRCSAAVTPVNLLPVRDRRLLNRGHTVNLGRL